MTVHELGGFTRQGAVAMLVGLLVLNFSLLVTVLHAGSQARSKDEIFAREARLKIEAGAGAGGEGPAWHPQLGVLTSGNGHIYQLDRSGRSLIYRKNAGTNGLLFDQQGRLLACEPALRRITRTERDGKI